MRDTITVRTRSIRRMSAGERRCSLQSRVVIPEAFQLHSLSASNSMLDAEERSHLATATVPAATNSAAKRYSCSPGNAIKRSSPPPPRAEMAPRRRSDRQTFRTDLSTYRIRMAHANHKAIELPTWSAFTYDSPASVSYRIWLQRPNAGYAALVDGGKSRSCFGCIGTPILRTVMMPTTQTLIAK